MPIYVQFSDSKKTSVIAAFAGPQDKADVPNQGEVEEGDARYQAFLAVLSPQPSLADVIAARRYQAETAGYPWGDYGIATDRESRSLIDQEVSAIDRGERQDGEDWKCLDLKTGAVTWWSATNAEYQKMASAVRLYVKACFAREKALVEAVAAGAYTPDMLEQGWPS